MTTASATRPRARRERSAHRSLARVARTLAGGVALCLALAAFAAGPPSSLSYDDAMRLAEQGPSVQLAQRALALAERQLAIASAPVRGELSAGYAWTSGERDPGIGDPVDLSGQGFEPITLTLTTPLLRLGSAGDAIARARAEVRRAEADLASARRAARIDVTSAFQGVLRARAALALAEAEADLADLELRATELRAAAGAATEGEIARVTAAVSRAGNVVSAAAFEVDAAQRTLELLLGGPVPAPVGPLPPHELLGASEIGPAWEARGDVLAAQQGLAETERSAAATLRDQLPSLGVSVAHARGDADRSLTVAGSFDTRALQPSLSLRYDPDTGVPGIGPDGSSRSLTLSVTLRVPLDPSVGSALEASRLARERAQLQLELTRSRAELDVERRAFEYASASADADLARASAELARSELAIAEARFASGALSELAIARARLDELRAALDAERAADAARLAALRLLDALATDPEPHTPDQE